jgi:MFS family permease
MVGEVESTSEATTSTTQRTSEATRSTSTAGTTGTKHVPLTRRHDFRRLWLGQTVSTVGSTVSDLAIPVVAISVLGASTFQVSLLTAVQMAAPLLIALPAGALLDRIRCRPVLVAADLGRAAALVTVPLAAVFGFLSLAHVIVATLVVALLSTLFDVAYQSYLPRLIDRHVLLAGNSRLEASRTVAAAAGPALSGVLIRWLTAPIAILVDVLTFVWSAAAVASIRTPEPRPVATPARHLGREIGEGLRYVARHPVLRALAAGGAVWVFFSAAQTAVLLVFLIRTVGLSVATVGVLLGVSTLGAVAGSAVASWFTRRWGTGRVLLVFAPLEGLAGFLVATTENDWKLGLLVLAFVVGEGSVMICGLVNLTYRQSEAPEHLLGRVNATMRFLLWGARPFGALLGGLLGTAVGLRESLVVAAAGMVSATFWFVCSPIRRTRDLPRWSDDANLSPSAGP